MPNVVWMLLLSTCWHIASASSMRFLACPECWSGFLPCSNVRRMLSIVWCMCSYTALVVGLQLDDDTSEIFICWSDSWNSYPVNSPPLSWMQHSGQGYLNSTLGKSICGAPALDHSQNSHLPYLRRNVYSHRTITVDDLDDLSHHDDVPSRPEPCPPWP